jgi:RNA polymerase sigma-70 factor (ECF subfamily)
VGPTVTEESDEIDRLVAAVVAGDRAALNQLLVILRPLVVRYCRSRLGTERGGVAADDVAQEVCLAVLKALPSYTDQGKPFLAFVYGIAAHKVVDAHRHAGRDRSEPTDEVPEGFTDSAGPEQHALEMSASAEMRALLEQLPAKQREILVLRVVVGLSAEETALAVGSTPGAVRVAQHRAVAKLRGVLDDPGEDRGPDDTPPRGVLAARGLSTRGAGGTQSGRRGRA